ncbi:alanine--tRNA ligase, partial [Candidatus Aerophobetes bacterium]
FFLGKKKPPASRLASCQLCFRTNDLDRVGETSYHHTLFEMLGNFSLGDYFKEDACQWGWEFVTKELGLSESRIWITIFKEDDETYQIWKKIGIPASRILRKGEEENFWSLAEVGPCGPDTEIFFDRGKEWGCSRTECLPGCNNCSRWVELWNLVFMQFNRGKEGILSPLPSKNIDTGMGLERTASVLQEVESDYYTDLFSPILHWLKGILPENREEERGLKVISDHLRALTFLLGEGILPSNVGKGYVVRRVLRRAYRSGRRLGLEDAFLYKGVPVVIKMMQEPYPYLKEKEEEIVSVIKAEERNFQATLSRGMEILEAIISDLKRKNKRVIPYQDVFKLYDTYGFPLELTEEIAQEEGLKIDKKEYNILLTEQRERGRKRTIEVKEMVKVGDSAKVAITGASRVGEEIIERLKQKYNLDAAKIFQGYEELKLDTTLVGILKEGMEVEKIAQGEEGKLILASTPFYPEGGGQLGDRGKIFTSDSSVKVLDTQKMSSGLILHRVKVLKGEFKKESRVIAEVDGKRRKAIARAHTATHLLQAALRKILGKIVKQSGSLVEEDRFRFDFTYFSPLTRPQLKKITSLLNEKIRENLSVTIEEMSLDEAQRKGAIALFEPKYKEKVRVVSIGEFSREVCGGTHLSGSGEIGVIQITSESGVASGIRRIEALLGEKALVWLEEKEELLQKIAAVLETQENAILPLIKEKNEKLESQAEELKRWQKRSVEMENLIRKASQIGSVKIIREKWDNLSAEVLRETAEKLKDRLKEGVVVLASVVGNKAFLVAASTQKNLPANKIIKEVCQVAGGSGGGRWDFAQGGTSSLEKIDEALKEVPLIVERLLEHPKEIIK